MSAIPNTQGSRRGAKPAAGLFDGLLVDLFCGAGGVSIAIEEVTGRAVDVAVNHWPRAIWTHNLNHPHTRHYREEAWSVDPVEATGGRKVRLLHLSPDCTDHSNAKAGRPLRKSIRGLAWLATKWAAMSRPDIITLENVPEFLKWGPLSRKRGREKHPRRCGYREGRTFQQFVAQLRAMGYVVDWRVLDAADYGAPTHRRRLLLVARCDGGRMPFKRVPTHGPNRAKPYRTAAECIDESLPCPSIFLAPEEVRALGLRIKRPLEPNTERRLAKGLVKFVIEAAEPYIIGPGGRTAQVPPYGVSEPFNTVTAKNDKALVVPYVFKVNHGGADGRGHPVVEPLSCITAQRRGHALGVPYLVECANSKWSGGIRDGNRPMATITALPRGGSWAMAIPTLVKFYRTGVVKPLGEPVDTITGTDRFGLMTAFLAKHYGGVVGHGVDRAIGTITATDHHSLVTGHLVKLRGSNGWRPMVEPLDTVCAGATTFGMVATHLLKFRGESRGADLRVPLPTITAGTGSVRPAGAAHAMGLSCAYLMKRYGTSTCADVRSPLPAITSGGNHLYLTHATLCPTPDPRVNLGFWRVYAFLVKYLGPDAPLPMVRVGGQVYLIVDVGMRMLKPHELLAAQFGPERAKKYILTGNQEEQVGMIGNSVPPDLYKGVLEELWESEEEEVAA